MSRPMGCFILAIALFFLSTSCKSATRPVPAPPEAFGPISASQDAPRSTIGAADGSIVVPELRGLSGRVEGQYVVWTARLYPEGHYSPVDGWSVQIFMNTDQKPTGYSSYGYDYSAYDQGEVDMTILRFADSELIGYAGLHIQGDRMKITVPLSVIQDDGAMDWRAEVYRDGGLHGLYFGSVVLPPVASRLGSSRRSVPGRR